MRDIEDRLENLSDVQLPEPLDLNELRERVVERRRRRRLSLSAGVAVLVVMAVAALGAIGGLLQRDQPPVIDEPDEQVDHVGEEVETHPHAYAPVPHVEVVGEQTVVPLRLADGTRIEVRYPAELDFTSHGFMSGVPAVSIPGFDRDAIVFYRSRDEVRNRLSDPEVLATYPDGRGGVIEFWRLEQDEVDYLAFEIGSWTVLYYDYREGGAGPRMSDRDRQLFAASYIGELDQDGFLVVRATPPLEFYDTGAHAAGISITGDSGAITVTNSRCDPHPDQPFRGSGDGYLHWCDEDTGFTIRLSADSEILDAVGGRVVVTLAE